MYSWPCRVTKALAVRASTGLGNRILCLSGVMPHFSLESDSLGFWQTSSLPLSQHFTLHPEHSYIRWMSSLEFVPFCKLSYSHKGQ